MRRGRGRVTKRRGRGRVRATDVSRSDLGGRARWTGRTCEGQEQGQSGAGELGWCRGRDAGCHRGVMGVGSARWIGEEGACEGAGNGVSIRGGCLEDGCEHGGRKRQLGVPHRPCRAGPRSWGHLAQASGSGATALGRSVHQPSAAPGQNSADQSNARWNDRHARVGHQR